MSNLWGKLLCAMSGHRRGKRIKDMGIVNNQVIILCPRCGATWTRKVKVKP